MSDTASLTTVAVQDTETVTVAEIVRAARSLGIRSFPDADRMLTGRVWPGGHGWVAEVGEGGTLRALDDMYESMVEAIKAVDTEIRQLRDTAASALRHGGGQAARLAASRDQWQPPVLEVFADADQDDPWHLQLPA